MFTSKIAAHVKLTAIASLAVGFLTGCPSMPMMTTAKTIGDAKNELTIAPGVVGFSASAFGGSGTLTLPDVGLGYRRGIGDSFDLGVTVGGFGHLQLDGKVNFLGNAKGDKFALAIDPTVGGVFIGAGNVGAGYVDFAVPVLMDLAVNDSVRFTIGPRYRGYLLFAGASGVGRYRSRRGVRRRRHARAPALGNGRLPAQSRRHRDRVNFRHPLHGRPRDQAALLTLAGARAQLGAGVVNIAGARA